jgi:hypothetical protein
VNHGRNDPSETPFQKPATFLPGKLCKARSCLDMPFFSARRHARYPRQPDLFFGIVHASLRIAFVALWHSLPKSRFEVDSKIQKSMSQTTVSRSFMKCRQLTRRLSDS